MIKEKISEAFPLGQSVVLLGKQTSAEMNGLDFRITIDVYQVYTQVPNYNPLILSYLVYLPSDDPLVKLYLGKTVTTTLLKQYTFTMLCDPKVDALPDFR